MQNSLMQTNIKYVFDINIKNMRFVDQLSFLRDELEILTFEKDFLFSQLFQDIQSCSFVLFVDVFELYRNMYKSLTEVYAMSVVLFSQERQKSTNSFVLILESHETNFRNVMIFLQTDMKISDDD